MAITSTYPIIVPKVTDLIVGTQTYTAADPVLDNPTRNFTVQSIVNLATAGISLLTAGTSGVSTLTAGVLNIPNYAADPSIVKTTGDQTIGGTKTFTTNISAPNVGGNNTGDQSLSINGQVITISGTNSTVTLPSFSGVTLDTAQTITGIKTFTNAVTITDRLVLNDSQDNNFIGYNSGISNTTGTFNVALGYQVLQTNTSGGYNIALGSLSLQNNTTGSSNIALGHVSLQSNTTGTSNIALGISGLQSNTTGSHNVALGNGSLNDNTSGLYNVSLGFASMRSNITGSHNIGLGWRSGQYIADGSGNTSGSSSIFIGKDARANGSNQINQIVIGDVAIGNGNNTATLGNDSIVKTILKGSIGIGTDSPDSLLNLEGAKNTSIITLGSTNNDGGWSVGDKIGAIDFYSYDGSGAGAGLKASISYENEQGNTAEYLSLVFRTAGTATGTNNTERIRIGSDGNTTFSGDVVLKVDGNGFAKIKTDTTGTVMIGDPAAGVATGINVTGDITMQSSTAAINLTSATAAIYMTSPDGTTYKVQMANGGTFNITQV